MIFLFFVDFESLEGVRGWLGFEDFSECGGFWARFLGAVWRVGGELLQWGFRSVGSWLAPLSNQPFFVYF